MVLKLRNTIVLSICLALGGVACDALAAPPGGGGGTPPPSTTISKNNGVILVNSNVFNVPMISAISVLGTPLLQYDNPGAGLQMTARSSAGNAYNPTQAGDCAGNPSTLLSSDSNWTGSGTGLPAANGVLLSVAPRNYNEPSSCLGAGAVLPFQFDFGMTQGDGVVLPKEGMYLDMTYTRLPGADAIDKGQSEMPAAFPLADVLPLAYVSPDGINFAPFAPTGTNDIRSWQLGVNYGAQGEVVAVCTPQLTMCMAIFSSKSEQILVSHRQGASHNLAYMTLLAGSGSITDFAPHHGKKLLAVGTLSTITAVIATARSHVTDWGEL